MPKPWERYRAVSQTPAPAPAPAPAPEQTAGPWERYRQIGATAPAPVSQPVPEPAPVPESPAPAQTAPYQQQHLPEAGGWLGDRFQQARAGMQAARLRGQAMAPEPLSVEEQQQRIAAAHGAAPPASQIPEVTAPTVEERRDLMQQADAIERDAPGTPGVVAGFLDETLRGGRELRGGVLNTMADVAAAKPVKEARKLWGLFPKREADGTMYGEFDAMTMPTRRTYQERAEVTPERRKAFDKLEKEAFAEQDRLRAEAMKDAPIVPSFRDIRTDSVTNFAVDTLDWLRGVGTVGGPGTARIFAHGAAGRAALGASGGIGGGIIGAPGGPKGIIAGAKTGAGIMGNIGGIGGSFHAGLEQYAPSVYRPARELGLEPDEAARLATASGAAASGVSLILPNIVQSQMIRALGGHKVVQQGIRQHLTLLGGMGWEGGAESLASIFTLSARIIAGEEITGDQFAEEVANSAAGGLLLGGTMTSMPMAVQSIMSNRDFQSNIRQFYDQAQTTRAREQYKDRQAWQERMETAFGKDSVKQTSEDAYAIDMGHGQTLEVQVGDLKPPHPDQYDGYLESVAAEHYQDAEMMGILQDPNMTAEEKVNAAWQRYPVTGAFVTLPTGRTTDVSGLIALANRNDGYVFDHEMVHGSMRMFLPDPEYNRVVDAFTDPETGVFHEEAAVNAILTRGATLTAEQQQKGIGGILNRMDGRIRKFTGKLFGKSFDQIAQELYEGDTFRGGPLPAETIAQRDAELAAPRRGEAPPAPPAPGVDITPLPPGMSEAEVQAQTLRELGFDPEPQETPPGAGPYLAMDNLDAMKRTELVDEAKRAGVKVKGTNDVLRAKIREKRQEGVQDVTDVPPRPPAAEPESPARPEPPAPATPEPEAAAPAPEVAPTPRDTEGVLEPIDYLQSPETPQTPPPTPREQLQPTIERAGELLQQAQAEPEGVPATAEDVLAGRTRDDVAAQPAEPRVPRPEGWDDYQGMTDAELIEHARDRKVEIPKMPGRKRPDGVLHAQQRERLIAELEDMNKRNVWSVETFDARSGALEDIWAEFRKVGVAPPDNKTTSFEDWGFPEGGRDFFRQMGPMTVRRHGYSWDQWIQQINHRYQGLIRHDADAQELFDLFKRARAEWKGEAGFLTKETSVDAYFEGMAAHREQAQQAEAATESVARIEPRTVNEAELETGTLVFRDGEWHKVTKDADGALLKNGETERVGNFDSIDVDDVVTPDDPRYRDALIEHDAQELWDDEGNFALFSTAIQAERDHLLQRAGGDANRAWHLYERQLADAQRRNEPVDPQHADEMRRALLGEQEQGDLFGEAPEAKPKRTRIPIQERPVQQSLEGLDDGALFSTKWQDLEEQKILEYGSKNKWYASQEYRTVYPQIKAEYDQHIKDKAERGRAIVSEMGLKEGDTVEAPEVSPFGVGDMVTGSLYFDKNGLPRVRLNNPEKYPGGKKSVPWHKGWQQQKDNWAAKQVADTADGGQGMLFSTATPVEAVGDPSEVYQRAREAGYKFGVHRGAPTQHDTVLDPHGGAIWFSNDPTVAETYEVDRATGQRGETRGYFIDPGSNPLVVECHGRQWTDIPFEGRILNTEMIVTEAQRRGHTSVQFDNVIDGGSTPSTVHAVFDSSQAKLSAPVTHDDAGHVIPLEQRFDQTQDDVRFSVADRKAADAVQDTWRDTTGDVVQGDTIRFTESVFAGSYKKPRYVGDRTITAEVLNDSYGKDKQQHTFTLHVLSSEGTQPVESGTMTTRKGRNVYKNGTERLEWTNEQARVEAAEEKHTRGDRARDIRRKRKEQDTRFSTASEAGIPDGAGERTIAAAAKEWKEKGTGRDVFYTGKAEVIKNPIDSDYRQLSKEYKREFPQDASGTPATRTTYDEKGNKYIWRSDYGMHDDIEPFISRIAGTQVGQNPDTLFSTASEAGIPDGAGERTRAAAAKEWKEKGTDSRFFRRWFGDAKVVDDAGEPLVVYHGTTRGDKSQEFPFTIFDIERSELGAHFGVDKGQASSPARKTLEVYLNIQNPIRLKDKGSWGQGTLEQIKELGIDTSSAESEINRIWKSSKTPGKDRDAIIRKLLNDNGYDGIVYLNRREIPNQDDYDFQRFQRYDPDELNGMSDAEFAELFPKAQDSYIAFSPEQIKSATGNIGTFDAGDADTRYSTAMSREPIPGPAYAAPAMDKKAASEIVGKVTRHFGTTSDPKEAGYIRPDGKMLDLSGKKEGGSKGVRHLDHRDLPNLGGADRNEYMLRAKNAGLVRVDFGQGLLNITRPLTPKQKSVVLRQMEQAQPDYITFEVDNPQTHQAVYGADMDGRDIGALRRALNEADAVMRGERAPERVSFPDLGARYSTAKTPIPEDAQQRYGRDAFMLAARFGEDADGYKTAMKELHGDAVEPHLDQFREQYFERRAQVIRQMQQAARQDPPAGRDDLVNIGETPEAQTMLDRVDEARTQAGLPEPETMADWRADAERMLATDYEGTRRRIEAMALQGETLGPQDTAAARIIYNDLAQRAISEKDTDLLADAELFADAYREAGSAWGRAGRARQQQLRDETTPVDRLRAFLLAPRYALEDRMQSLKRKARRAKMPTRAKQQAIARDLRKLHQQHARDIAPRLHRLEEMGYDLSQKGLDAIVADDYLRANLIRDVSSLRSSYADVIHELRLSSMLSGLVTHRVNLLSSKANHALETYVQRGFEALVNTVYRDPDAAQWGEIPIVLKRTLSALPGCGLFQQAASNALKTWHTELRTLEGQITGQDIMSSARLDSYRGPAVAGSKGRAARVALRFMMACDEFQRTLYASIEVGAQAYRMAKAEGLTGLERQQRMQDLIDDISSDAWRTSYEAATRHLFQDTMDTEIGHGFMDIRRKTPGGRHVIPFARTPMSLFRTLMRKAGGAAFALPFDIGETGDTKVRHAAETMMAGLFWTTLYQLLKGDDNEDDLPRITGTNHPQGSQRWTAEAYEIPQNSIRIGNRYYRYTRIAPFGPALSLMVTGMETMRGARTADEFASAAAEAQQIFAREFLMETPMLKGISDVISVMTGQQSGKWLLQNYAGSYVPNILKSGLRSAEDKVPERAGLSFKDGALQTAFPGPGMAPPKVNIWGEEMEKGGTAAGRFSSPWPVVQTIDPDSETEQYNRLIRNWNANNPDDQFRPRGPANWITHQGERIDLSPEQYNTYRRNAGQYAMKELARQHLNASEPKARDIQLIKNALSTGRERARDELIREHLTEHRMAQ